ncbi:uncharacterized protein LOC116343636 [Contarinia nasturtii]|uniref:uncharacterized protein LOC116343636 n=1 Tax=Contarinia nasturtii TaxID=265458 RepID=UPI0012D4A89D|nr:uncharacterized protein LOC116343636 [Contarinia nasturtii]
MKVILILSVVTLALIPALYAGKEESTSELIYIPNIQIDGYDIKEIGKPMSKEIWRERCTGRTGFSKNVPKPIGKATRKVLDFVNPFKSVKNSDNVVDKINEVMEEFESVYQTDKDKYVQENYENAKNVIATSVDKLSMIYCLTPSDTVRTQVSKICDDLYTCMEKLEGKVFRKPWYKKSVATATLSFFLRP